LTRVAFVVAPREIDCRLASGTRLSSAPEIARFLAPLLHSPVLMRPFGSLRLPRVLPALLGVLWMLTVCTGLVVLQNYENRPGLAATPPSRWPAGSHLERAAGRATLVMLVHPGCPCSRASIEELDRIMARSQGLVSAHVLFFKPREFAEGWEKTDLWQKAAAIPGVEPRRDDDGAEASLFRAATSGQVVLYDASGALRFSGGITPSRGHAGDSEGRQGILALLTANEAPRRARTPVFGCSLRDPDAPTQSPRT
jgi:hypothetical protein